MSWACILGASPFAILGFVKYNGMTAEKFILAWFRSEFITPKRLCFQAKNIYYELNKENIQKRIKEGMKSK